MSEFTPIWVVLARFMASQCRHCNGKGLSHWTDADCPYCRELRALLDTAPAKEGDG